MPELPARASRRSRRASGRSRSCERARRRCARGTSTSSWSSATGTPTAARALPPHRADQHGLRAARGAADRRRGGARGALGRATPGAHERLRGALGALGCERLAPEGEQLHPLLAVRAARGHRREAAVRKRLLTEHGIEIGGGLGPLAGQALADRRDGRRRASSSRRSASSARSPTELGGSDGRALAALRAVIDPAAFARLLVGYCLEVERGQQVLVRSTTLAAPLLLELQREILEREAWPLLRVELPGADARLLRARARRRTSTATPALALRGGASKANASLAIQAPENTRALAAIDPERLARAAVGRAARAQGGAEAPLVPDRVADRGARAGGAGMALADFERVRRAGALPRPPDPVAAWGGPAPVPGRARSTASNGAARSASRPRAPTSTLERQGPHAGSTATASATCRAARSSPARTRRAPNGRSASTSRRAPPASTSRASSSSSATARSSPPAPTRATSYLQRALATDDGARRLGELGIGTNFGIDRPVGTILFDEKIGGTVHLALGRSYPGDGRQERVRRCTGTSICDLRRGGRITADGEVVQENGRFAAWWPLSSRRTTTRATRSRLCRASGRTRQARLVLDGARGC